MEQALVRFGRFVNDMGKAAAAATVISRSPKSLLNNRGNSGGTEYDQTGRRRCRSNMRQSATRCARLTHIPAWRMSRRKRHDVDYQSAVMSLWDNIVNKKYYVTGGTGSGETRKVSA